MSAGPRPQDNFPDFQERYSTPNSDVEGKIEHEVFGHSFGVDGFTTVEQAAALGTTLEVGPQSTVLELGAGRGWLGGYVAEASGCRLVCSDIPTDALGECENRFSSLGLTDRASVVGVDGRALPFREQSFDAVMHSDVFC